MLTVGFGVFRLYASYPNYQWTITIIIAVLYVVWGALHHAREGDLHVKIMIEYTLIAFIVLLIVRGALFR